MMRSALGLRGLLHRLKSVTKDILLLAVERYFPFLAEGLVSRRLRSQANLAISKYTIASGVDPLAALNYLSQKAFLSKALLWQVLCELHDERSPAFYRVVEQHEKVQDVELRLLLAVKWAYIQTVTDEGYVRGVVDFFVRNSSCFEEVKKIKSNLVSLIIDKSPPGEIDFFISAIGVRRSSLTELQKVKLLCRVAKLEDVLVYEQWEKVFFVDLSMASQLKVFLAKYSAQGRRQSFSLLEELFCQLNIEVAKFYLLSIKPYFDSLQDRRFFLDARFDLGVLEEMRGEIIKKIINEQPYAYIRLGDGECYGFGENNYIDQLGISRQELHWWGTELDEELRRELQSKFCDALPYADMLGVPTVLRLIRDFNPSKQDEYPKNSLMARLFSVMEGAAPFMESRIIVEDQSNLYLFDAEFIERLVRLAKKVYVVSGVSAALVDAWNPDSSKIEHIEIPTHRLLKVGNVGSEVSGIFPLVYQEYIDRVSQLAGPGIVFLFSAGFIGKILIAEVARKGSVGLDVGQYLLSAVTE